MSWTVQSDSTSVGKFGIVLDYDFALHKELLIIDLADTQSTGPVESREVEALPLKAESIRHVSAKRECFMLPVASLLGAANMLWSGSN